ncbi:endochitinase-like [Rhipicephalus sanguineus]|uniref:endochitinase-like n=1 Tax=Rhipicephalus sanguineus TaxID=34632 RepID=UPI0020C4ACD9|nr:endochitinase-like [Rhipicephalus sanguineus]
MSPFQIDRAELIVKKGAPRQRIVLEVPLSARTYTTTPAAFGVHTVFPGFSGNYTNLQGSLASFEVCDQLQSGWEQGLSSPDSCPFLKKDEDYVAYEDEESANMVMGRKYRGAAVRSVDLDDYNSQCAGKTNLLKALRSSFDAAKADMDYPYNPPTAWWWDGDNDKMIPTTAPPPKWTTTRPPEEVSTPTQEKEPAGTNTPTTGKPVPSTVMVPASKDPSTVLNTLEKVAPAETTTTPVSGDLQTVTPAESYSKSSTLATSEEVTTKSREDICKGAKQSAMLPHESDCSKYYHCVHSKPLLQNCAPGTIFDIERQICNWPAITNRRECKLS